MKKINKIASLVDDFIKIAYLNKVAFIKKLPNGKYRVVSEKGKNLGTFNSKSDAENRLKQIEFFKHRDKNKSEDIQQNNRIDLTKIDDFSYSAILRKLRQQTSQEQFMGFLKLFKDNFEKAVKKQLQQPDQIALQKTLIQYNKLHKIKLNKDLIKSASISELGDPNLVGKYVADIIRFTLHRIPTEQRANAIESLKRKIYALNENEISGKDMPPTSSIGQAITFVKHMLFNHESGYVRDVINSIVRNLAI